MSANYASIKLSTAFVGEARREAEVLHRSVGSQIEYWAKLGRAIENTPGFNIERIRSTLSGRPYLDGQTASEQAATLESLSAAFDAPDVQTRDHFATLGEQPGAVGSDGKGGIVRRQPMISTRRTS